MADTQKLAFKNNEKGPRGVNGVNGLVMVEAGKTEVVEVNEAEFNSAKATGYFEIGKAKDDAEDEGDGLDALKVEDLKALAAAEEVNVEGLTKKADLLLAIRTKRAG